MFKEHAWIWNDAWDRQKNNHVENAGQSVGLAHTLPIILVVFADVNNRITHDSSLSRQDKTSLA